MLFPVTKQETWSLACDWKCSEQTLPIPATSDQTQSGAHALTVQTPCVKVALYARGLHARDVMASESDCVQQSKVTWLLYFGFVCKTDSNQLDAIQLTIRPGPSPTTLSAHQSDVPGFHSTWTTTAALETGEEKISPTWCTAVSALSTCTVHAWSLWEWVTSPGRGKGREERGDGVVSFVSPCPVVITRTILDLIDLLSPCPSYWVQLCGHQSVTLKHRDGLKSWTGCVSVAFSLTLSCLQNSANQRKI